MMKNTFIMILSLFLINCGKKELHNKVIVLETEISELKKENSLLLGELKGMETRMDSVANLPATIFSRSHYYLIELIIELFFFYASLLAQLNDAVPC